MTETGDVSNVITRSLAGISWGIQSWPENSKSIGIGPGSENENFHGFEGLEASVPHDYTLEYHPETLRVNAVNRVIQTIKHLEINSTPIRPQLSPDLTRGFQRATMPPSPLA
ncbi:hypothetical protein H072_5416 [Dactylellina haptotyla CBS 200.50]|uniref:Uncharacterized protein n=1 Tax=Dactylellina haptotyla (strain CBS 200.50) TaxID=1284197 RepID=S8ACP2_DACHA|nr:hypothetical protein H072_5416 [Dactylellina haptotyla CBS 200.50]